MKVRITKKLESVNVTGWTIDLTAEHAIRNSGIIIQYGWVR